MMVNNTVLMEQYNDQLVLQYTINGKELHYSRLHYAVANRNMFMIQVLLEVYRADINNNNNFESITPLQAMARHTPLQAMARQAMARQDKDVQITKFLLDREADMARQDKDIQITKFLLDHGADINKIGDFGRTALHMASYHGNINIIIVLLDYDADYNATDNAKETPIEVARDPIVKATLERYIHMIKLKEWRPWNHIKYPEEYQQAMKTLLLLSKT